MKNLFFALLLLGILFSCKNETKNNGTNPLEVPVPADHSPAVDPATLVVPSACEMISETDLKEALDLSSDTKITIKKADDPGNTKSQSCFFKWDDPRTPNAGILIQITTNPIFSEYPEYISNYVTSKLTSGDNVMGSDVPILYKKFDVNGKIGAYSFDQARFYWSNGNNYLLMLAFNVSTLSESEMVDAADDMIEKINANFASKVKQ